MRIGADCLKLDQKALNFSQSVICSDESQSWKFDDC